MNIKFQSIKKTLILLAIMMSVIGCGIFFLLRDQYQPLHLIEADRVPLFDDDYNLSSLIAATTSQIAFLKKEDQQKQIHFSDRSYPISWLLVSAQEFLNQLGTSPSNTELQTFIVANYTIYQAGGRESAGKRRMLVTGYYEPLFQGSLTKDLSNMYPVYYPPKFLTTKLSAEGKNIVGRIDDNNQFTTFWTRAEIENNNLLKGYELAYLQDPFDAYLLHIQGSGKIQLPNNELLSVRFAGSNGLDYNSIGKLLVDEKILALEDVSIPTIRKYLKDNPDQLKRIFHHNPRFIFFVKGDNLGPRGSSGERLTPGRSVAIDNESLPAGTIAFLMSKSPDIDNNGTITNWRPLHRFVFPQDSGAAIKGTGRIDMFWGNGKHAEIAANHMKEDGQLYFLVKKLLPSAEGNKSSSTQL